MREVGVGEGRARDPAGRDGLALAWRGLPAGDRRRLRLLEPPLRLVVDTPAVLARLLEDPVIEHQLDRLLRGGVVEVSGVRFDLRRPADRALWELVRGAGQVAEVHSMAAAMPGGRPVATASATAAARSDPSDRTTRAGQSAQPSAPVDRSPIRTRPRTVLGVPEQLDPDPEASGDGCVEDLSQRPGRRAVDPDKRDAAGRGQVQRTDGASGRHRPDPAGEEPAIRGSIPENRGRIPGKGVRGGT